VLRRLSANWQHLGSTQGRTRQDRHRAFQVAAEDLNVYPLAHPLRKVLNERAA